MTAKVVEEPVKNIVEKFTDKGIPEAGFYYVLYWLSIFKYATQSQLQSLPISAGKKIATKKWLSVLVEDGYINALNPDDHYKKIVYTPTNKLIELLNTDKARNKLNNYTGYFDKILRTVPKENAKGVEIYNTDIFLQAIKKDDFYALFHANFYTEQNKVILPDGVLILKNKNKFQINILEIESKKNYWLKHLEEKRENYLSVEKNDKTYNWWKSFCGRLGLPKLTKDKFKFNILFVLLCEEKERPKGLEDWEDGFQFVGGL